MCAAAGSAPARLGRRTFDSDDDGEVIGQFLTQFYGGQADIETGASAARG